MTPLTPLLLTLLGFLTVPLARPTAAPRPQVCGGCVGTGGSATASGGTCGGLVSITVNMLNGTCKVLSGMDPGDIQCRSIKGCLPVVTRTWSGLEPQSGLEFCVVLHGQTLCIDPKPSAGSGTGSDTRSSASMSCSDDPEDERSFSIRSVSCGLFASAQAKCSACDDFF